MDVYSDEAQFELERVLARSFYQAGVALQNNEENFGDSLSKLNDVLDKVIALDKFRFVKACFSLSYCELKLIALVFIQEIEPDCLTPYLGLTWYEQGPYLSLDKLLVLSNPSSQKRAMLNSGIYHKFAFKWGLFQSHEQFGLTQSIRLLPELLSFLQAKEVLFSESCLVSYPYNTPVDCAFSLFKGQQSNVDSNHNCVINDYDVNFIRWYVEQLANVHSALVSCMPFDMPNDVAKTPIIKSLSALLLASGGKKVFVVLPNWVSRYFVAGSELFELLRGQGNLYFFFSNETQPSVLPNVYEFTPKAPTIDALAQIWLEISKRNAPSIEDRSSAGQVAIRYPVPIYKMSDIATEALEQPSAQFWQVLKASCLKEQQKGPEGLATLTESRFKLKDMVLSEGVNQQLHELVSRINYQSELKSRLPRFTEGCKALFWGRPGTGKSMAAQAIAGELQLPIYEVNLANIASKWIGETEKHLAKLFDEAERYNAVLMFDEADAVFAKRSEVESSHDKNANMGVSYLLQRMERYSGLLLLSTNLKANLDEAFLRRFHSVVEFTLPDPNQRLAIWKRVIGSNASRELLSGIERLAKRFELSAAQIINITETALLQSLMLKQTSIKRENIAKALLRELSKQHEGFMAQHEIKAWLEGN
ncbi:ATP-binding protein [Pseudoalteromonas luteoviolacea]|uniref:AAA+ ATPase domain-containing protein n=1 Tax=Pseudoalteromonas luteoviolacea NCIMB 1942 TaxID=1365253 RepID=A0A167H8P2_9GAMM|nr:ATP-binding protein [Pseudoalteromonas luteoviolacea]KZN57761.1 hypothetical protein N482_04480 [Pseudoalteromonas luteoviolacea NCIMB 1942]